MNRRCAAGKCPGSAAPGRRECRGICTKQNLKATRIPHGRCEHTPSTGQRPCGQEKMGSSPISRVLSRRLAPAGQSFLWATRYRDALAAYPGALRATSTPPYLALPRMGFAVPVLLPVLRWALTRQRLRPAHALACAWPRTVSPLPDRAGRACARPACSSRCTPLPEYCYPGKNLAAFRPQDPVRHRRSALCCTFRRLGSFDL
jgi:hypothetical protein